MRGTKSPLPERSNQNSDAWHIIVRPCCVQPAEQRLRGRAEGHCEAGSGQQWSRWIFVCPGTV